LLALTEIRDNVLDKIKDKSEDMEAISKEFDTLSAFEKKFYDKIFGIVACSISVSKENPA
jgi:hypothetical protein